MSEARGTVITVIITEVDSGQTYTARVCAEHPNAALPQALHQLWGAGTLWWPEPGRLGYGQVFKGMPIPGQPGKTSYDSRTNRARLEFKVLRMSEALYTVVILPTPETPVQGTWHGAKERRVTPRRSES
jgi:hypothetical protein